MDIERFETISLYVGCSVLIGYMLFIIWRLARESKAGRFGTIMLFVVLAVGMIGFIAKELMILFMDV
jgi:ABC-type lipoprotein release transport system permease subunit